MPNHIRNPAAASGRHRGFALLITITLLAFLVLLLVSLSSMTRVETQVTANSQAAMQARQNALMALNIAIGQLQKYTGPDQRVTATADIITPASITIPSPDSGTTSSPFPVTTAQSTLTAINNYWAAPRNAHWTGVWQNTNTTTYDPNNPTAYNPIPSPTPQWLVSGDESAATPTAPAAYLPTDVVSGLTASSTPLDEIKGDNGQYYRLLVDNSAGASSSLGLAVTAPEIAIQSSGVPGISGSATVGHYAWWVGDEGVKARANLVDPYAPTPPETAANAAPPNDPTNLARRLSAQRPAIEAITTTGTDDLGTYPANNPELLNVLALPQLELLPTSPISQSALGPHFYDLTTVSRGVLADVNHGGLKRDLTYILGSPSLTAFRTALDTVSAGWPAYRAAPANTWNPVISTATTPYAATPSDVSGAPSYTGSPGILQYSATWEQLWSFYNMGNSVTGVPSGVMTSSGIAQARPTSATQMGLFPVLVQAKIFYNLSVGADGDITVQITPVAVLANPYNVPLSGNFLLYFYSPTPNLVCGTMSPDGTGTPTEQSTDPNAGLVPGASGYTYNVFSPLNTSKDLGAGYLGAISLVIQATDIPAGTAQIFTIDPSQSASTLTIASSTDSHKINMINAFDPTAFITYDTKESIRSDDTQVALYGSGSIAPWLYMETNNTLSTSDYVNRVAAIATHNPTTTSSASAGVPVFSSNSFIVYPVSSGGTTSGTQGGGIFCALEDGNTPSPQQAPFYQVNYRALQVDYTGDSTYNDHPLQWGVSYAVAGQPGNGGGSYNPALSDNILPPPDSGTDLPTTTRWGLINSGAFPSLTTLPTTITDPNTSVVNLLYSIPASGSPITSLGQLEQFDLAGHQSGVTSVNSDRSSIMANSYQVNYPISNSYPASRVQRGTVFYASIPFSYNYDGSFLWNDILWDRFYFSSYPSSGAFDFTTQKLINSRYRPFRSAGTVAWNDPTQYRGIYLPAENLLVDGAFNINSTSVDAWEAVFSSLKGVPTGIETDPTNTNLSAPFTRTLSPAGDSLNAQNGVSANAWNGFCNLTQSQIIDLAEEMVLQVRLRGPFLSMSQFVNRLLIQGRLTVGGPTSDPYNLGLSGALQSAIDAVLNQQTNVPAPYNTQTPPKVTGGGPVGPGGTGLYLADPDYVMSTGIAGFPGYLLQGDVLSVLGPTLTARSDTFRIRTYGDVVNAVTGTVTGRAWCEAIVQRTPDYVVPLNSAGTAGNSPDQAPTDPTNAQFGRRYQIVGFRWLGPSDL